MRSGQSAASAAHLWSLTTCSRLEMFTLWDSLQTLPCAIFVLTVFLVIFLSQTYFSFLLCAFVAKRNSSYRQTSCHQHWSERCGRWTFSRYQLAFVYIITNHNPSFSSIILASMGQALSRSVRMHDGVNTKAEGGPNRRDGSWVRWSWDVLQKSFEFRCLSTETILVNLSQLTQRKTTECFLQIVFYKWKIFTDCVSWKLSKTNF